MVTEQGFNNCSTSHSQEGYLTSQFKTFALPLHSFTEQSPNKRRLSQSDNITRLVIRHMHFPCRHNKNLFGRWHLCHVTSWVYSVVAVHLRNADLLCNMFDENAMKVCYALNFICDKMLTSQRPESKFKMYVGSLSHHFHETIEIQETWNDYYLVVCNMSGIRNFHICVHEYMSNVASFI